MPEYEEISENFKRSLINKIQTTAPFWKLLGMELVDIKKGWAKVKLPFSRKLTHALGMAHGGAIFAPADSAIAMALLGMVARDQTLTTIEMKINYLRAFGDGAIIAEARIVHKGSNIALGEVEVTNDHGDIVAKALATCMIIKRKPNDLPD